MNDAKALADLLTLLLTDPRTGVLIALLLVAAVTDWRSMRIPNWLTVSGMLLGLAINTVEARSPAVGAWLAAGGLATGLLLLLPLYALRLLGAGDVKLMAAVGAFLGPWGVLEALLFVLVAGGLLALLWTLARGSLGQLALNLRLFGWSLLAPAAGSNPLAALPSVGKLPYAVGICAGTTAFLIARALGLV